uniref:(northern house mosquito) hypothetical protein n=1 Tax=Culex pipiens TaxID=7175 RepID=A0A8D7ZUD1_CULPI
MGPGAFSMSKQPRNGDDEAAAYSEDAPVASAFSAILSSRNHQTAAPGSKLSSSNQFGTCSRTDLNIPDATLPACRRSNQQSLAIVAEEVAATDLAPSLAHIQSPGKEYDGKARLNGQTQRPSNVVISGATFEKGA